MAELSVQPSTAVCLVGGLERGPLKSQLLGCFSVYLLRYLGQSCLSTWVEVTGLLCGVLSLLLPCGSWVETQALRLSSIAKSPLQLKAHLLIWRVTMFAP